MNTIEIELVNNNILFQDDLYVVNNFINSYLDVYIGSSQTREDVTDLMSEGNILEELRIYHGSLSNSTIENIYNNYFITLNNNEIIKQPEWSQDFFLEYLYHLINTNNSLVGFTLYQDKAIVANQTNLQSAPDTNTTVTSYVLTSKSQGVLTNGEQTNIYWTWEFEENSYYFNGINDYLSRTITNDLENLGQEWSLVFGVKSIQNSGENSFWIEKKSVQGNFIDFQIGPTPEGYLRIIISGQNGFGEFIKAKITTSGVKIIDGKYHFVVITRSQNLINCHIDNRSQKLKFFSSQPDSQFVYNSEATKLITPIQNNNDTPEVTIAAIRNWTNGINLFTNFTEVELKYIQIYNQVISENLKEILYNDFQSMF